MSRASDDTCTISAVSGVGVSIPGCGTLCRDGPCAFWKRRERAEESILCSSTFVRGGRKSGSGRGVSVKYVVFVCNNKDREIKKEAKKKGEKTNV